MDGNAYYCIVWFLCPTHMIKHISYIYIRIYLYFTYMLIDIQTPGGGLQANLIFHDIRLRFSSGCFRNISMEQQAGILGKVVTGPSCQ